MSTITREQRIKYVKRRPYLPAQLFCFKCYGWGIQEVVLTDGSYNNCEHCYGEGIMPIPPFEWFPLHIEYDKSRINVDVPE